MEQTNPRRGDPLPESRFTVVLVEPQFRENVGHTARTMLNFGVGDLILVNAAPVDEQTRNRAVHAQEVLNQARFYDSLDQVTKEFDHVVGFAARISTMDKAHRRMSESLPVVARRLAESPSRVALVFGREDFGLSNEDVERCDILCTIPTQRTYRSMNLSHAVAVALYEMTREDHPKLPYVSMAKPHEKEVLYEAWYHMTGQIAFPPHRREQSLAMFKRVIGRAGITSWEYHRLMGVFSRSLRRMGAWPIPGLKGKYAQPEDEDEGSDEPSPPGPPAQ